MTPASSFMTFRQTIECRFTLKLVRDMIITYSQKVCTTLKYIEHFLILVSAITGYVSTSYFVSLVGISKGIMSSALRLQIGAITA